MGNTTLKNQVIELLCELSGKEEVNVSDTLQIDLGFDSLGLVALLLALEDAFGFILDETDMNPFDLSTVQDVVRLTEKYYG